MDKSSIIKRYENNFNQGRDYFDDFSVSELREYLRVKENLNKYLRLCYKKVSKAFKKIEYVPQSLEDADLVLKYNILEIDKPMTIVGKFTNNGNEQLIEITPTTFYRAYNKEVWKNLSYKERAHIVKWHFDYKKNQVQFKDLEFKLLPTMEDCDQYQYCGMFGRDKKGQYRMYIDGNYIFEDDFMEVAHTIEHEFEHAKQDLLGNFVSKRNPEKVNIYEALNCVNLDASKIHIKGATKSQKINIYNGDPDEIAAEIRSMKNLSKYFKENKKFGLFDDDAELDFACYKDYVDYSSNLMNPSTVNKVFELSKQELEKYKKEHKLVKNLKYVHKLSLLRWYYETDDKVETKEAHKQLARIDKSLSIFIKTLKKNRYLEKQATEILGLNE